jgi:hypothetical protein
LVIPGFLHVDRENTSKYAHRMKLNESVFHYAPGAHLPSIVQSGMLRCSNAGGAQDEPPLLWFSSHPYWEVTATKMVWTGGVARLLSFQEQRSRFGCVRFALSSDDPRLMDWRAACQFAGLHKAARRQLEQVGRKRGGDPRQWFALGVPLAIQDLNFQALIGDAWHDALTAEVAKTWVDVHEGYAEKGPPKSQLNR